MPDDIDPIVPLSDADARLLAEVLELNRRNVVALSELDACKLKTLINNSFQAIAFRSANAFLLAFDQHAAYDSPNFRWFQDRFSRFVYIDRVVVADHARGRGLARALYRELFNEARQRGHSLLTCEINVDPPNPPSDRFHNAFGFEEVGTGRASPQKKVRYLVRRLDN
jgi:predicted GNAT superfamily acetyltransferase